MHRGEHTAPPHRAGSFEENDGLFVGVTDEDMAYLPGFLAGCEESGIPTQVLQPDEGPRLEPR